MNITQLTLHNYTGSRWGEGGNELVILHEFNKQFFCFVLCDVQTQSQQAEGGSLDGNGGLVDMFSELFYTRTENTFLLPNDMLVRDLAKARKRPHSSVSVEPSRPGVAVD